MSATKRLETLERSAIGDALVNLLAVIDNHPHTRRLIASGEPVEDYPINGVDLDGVGEWLRLARECVARRGPIERVAAVTVKVWACFFTPGTPPLAIIRELTSVLTETTAEEIVALKAPLDAL